MDRTPHVRRYGGLEALKWPVRTNAGERSQLFACLPNEERARYGHDPERWWAAVLSQRKQLT